jgi:hypothetical protein
MGATGSGKSTVRFLLSSFGDELPRNSLAHGFTQFINLISGSNLAISGGLRSCTNAVQFGGGFNLDGCRVMLIDTPGFDDTTRSDTAILTMIAAFLATS